MTLKQFFQIAGGALISLLFYSTNLNAFIKWPIILFFALLGVALAFLPFQERPLETWILAFFRSVYSPTLFSWNRTAKNTAFFQNEAPMPEEKIVFPGGEAKLQQYLSTATASTGSSLQVLENKELSFLSRLSNLFNFNQKPPTPSTTPASPVTTAPQIQKQLVIPKTPTPFIPRSGNVSPRLVVEESGQKRGALSSVHISPVSTTKSAQDIMAAKFSAEAAPPSPPTTPNVIVGQVLSSVGKIIEGAILEVKDYAGRPLRALKSNKLGHFVIVTPLQNGTYEIITDKDGYEFKTISFEATGEIIPPIAIEGKETT